MKRRSIYFIVSIFLIVILTILSYYIYYYYNISQLSNNFYECLKKNNKNSEVIEQEISCIQYTSPILCFLGIQTPSVHRYSILQHSLKINLQKYKEGYFDNRQVKKCGAILTDCNNCFIHNSFNINKDQKISYQYIGVYSYSGDILYTLSLTSNENNKYYLEPKIEILNLACYCMDKSINY